MTFGKYILGSNIWIHRDDFTSYDFMPKIWCKQLKSLGIISKLNQSLQARAWQARAWEKVYQNKLEIWFDLPFLAFYWHYKWVRWSREGSFLNPIYTLNTPKKWFVNLTRKLPSAGPVTRSEATSLKLTKTSRHTEFRRRLLPNLKVSYEEPRHT